MGWGTSGAGTCYPYLSTANTADYGPSTGSISGTEYDWGVHNPIENAGTSGTWRTLTSSEWDYLLNSRSVGKRYAKVSLSVGNNTIINGLVLFPDDYDFEDGLDCDDSRLGYASISLELWQQMEAEGAVFYRGRIK